MGVVYFGQCRNRKIKGILVLRSKRSLYGSVFEWHSQRYISSGACSWSILDGRVNSTETVYQYWDLDVVCLSRCLNSRVDGVLILKTIHSLYWSVLEQESQRLSVLGLIRGLFGVSVGVGESTVYQYLGLHVVSLGSVLEQESQRYNYQYWC